MSPLTNNGRQRRTERNLHAEIITDSQHGTQNAKTHHKDNIIHFLEFKRKEQRISWTHYEL